MTADAPIRQRARASRAAPIDGVRPDRRALADLRAGGWTIAVGSISVPSGTSRQQQLALGDDLIADDRRWPARLRQRRAPAPERDFEPQPIAGHDLPAEFGVVDAAQVDARVRRRVFALAAAGSPPPATATRASARQASAARRESVPGRTPR